MEQVELLADPAMVTLLGLLDALDIGGQLLLVGPGSAVDALQLLVLRVATPVRTGNAGQFECFQEAGIRHVRAAAHVHVFFVVIQTHRLLVGHIVDQAQLVILTSRREDLDDFGSRRHLLDDVVVLVDQLGHTLLDGRHVFRGKGTINGDVVIETLIDDRTDYHLGVRIQLLYRMTDQMRAGVANDLQPLLILRRDDLQRSIALDQITGVDQLAVDLASQGRLRKARADGLSDLSHGNGMIERTLTAIGKSNGGHGASSPSGDPYQRPHGLG